MGDDVSRAEMSSAAPDLELLADDRWVRNPAAVGVGPEAVELTSTDAAQGPLLGWRHGRLDEIFARPPHARPNLAAPLGDPEVSPIVAANAAIGLARWGDSRAAEPLLEAARSPQLKLPQRRAAIEALGTLQHPPPLQALSELYEQYGRYRPSERTTYLAEIHEELLTALARHVNVAADGRFIEALRSPADTVRLAALRAWEQAQVDELPLAVVDLRGDPDPRIRASVISQLGRRRHAQALDYTRTALNDYELAVRLSAVEALGHFGGDEARRMLRGVLLGQQEIMRAAAVAALAQCGDWEAVEQAGTDNAWRVRQAVAKALSTHPQSGVSLAQALLADSSSEVREQMLSSLESWPLETAGPLLLDVLENRGYLMRKLASEQLAQRWPAATEYTPDLPAERAAEVVSRLRQQWAAQYGRATAESNVVPVSYVEEQVAQPLPPDRLNRLATLVAELQRSGTPEVQWSARLNAAEPQLVDGLEQLVLERGLQLPETMYRDVLPAREAQFASLSQMQAEEVQQRRRAAERLARDAAEGPLRWLAVHRLAELGVPESDALVWRSMLMAIEHNSSEPAMRLAHAGLSHPSPEVRRLACAYLGRRADVRHAQALLPALNDPHVTVVREAVRGLGRPGAVANPAPLEALLSTKDKTLQLEVAVSLARIGAPTGRTALERLAHDADAEVRRDTATRLGRLNDASYTPLLIAMLDDSLDVQRAALAALPAAAGCDVPLPASASPQERTAAWKHWWRTNQDSVQVSEPNR